MQFFLVAVAAYVGDGLCKETDVGHHQVCVFLFLPWSRYSLFMQGSAEWFVHTDGVSCNYQSAVEVGQCVFFFVCAEHRIEDYREARLGMFSKPFV